MTDANLWNQILIWPIVNLLIAIYKGLSLLAIPGALGWAIIVLTIIIRGVLTPLTNAQLKSAKKLQELKPRLDELNHRHKDDKLKLQQAQMDLYKEVGINPASGCLPLLVQMPVLIGLYNVFIHVLGSGTSTEFAQNLNKILYFPWLHIDKLDLTFFSVNLTVKPNEWQTVGIWLLAIPLITAGLQYLQTRLMTPATAPVKKDQPKPETDQMADMQKQMSLIMPVMIGFLSLSFPLGLSLYWNTFSVFGIIQQLQINKSK